LSEWQYSWATRTAQIFEPTGPPGVYRGVNISPDTKRVAVHRHDANGGDIIVFEPRGSDTRLTLDASQHNSMPILSPDGSQVVFASLRMANGDCIKPSQPAPVPSNCYTNRIFRLHQCHGPRTGSVLYFGCRTPRPQVTSGCSPSTTRRLRS